jgi:indole-3-acetate monooxygenase
MDLQHNVILPGEDINEIQFQAAIAEKSGGLTPSLLSIIYKHKLFNLYVPAVSGGKEMQLPDAVRLLEYLSSVDGALGWIITLCSGANWFIGFLEKEVAAFFFSDERVCLAGSGAITGKATITDGGYIVKGRWKYATGAPHATAFTANCVLQKDGDIPLEEGGSKITRSFIFKRDEVTLIDDWRTTGMKATASQSFEVNNVFVTESRCFSIDATTVELPQAVYRFPFLQFAEVTIAINFCGMATHFTNECRVLFDWQIKDKAYSCAKASEMLEALGRATSILEGKRSVFYETLVDVWEKGKENRNWNSAPLQQLSTHSLMLAKACLRVVDELYPYCGMAAANETTVINKIWRDIHTASQHELMKFLYA